MSNMFYCICKICLTFLLSGALMKNTIREKRKEIKLSQDELAKKAGVTRQTINAIENDKYDPSLKLAFQLAAILQIRIDELFKFGDERDDQY